MNNRPKFCVVLFAKDISKLSHFYKEVAVMTPVHSAEDHVVLEAVCFQLLIHGIPKRIAAEIEITEPPQVREETAIKVCFPVSSIEQARSSAARLGGKVSAKAKEWEARGFRACDGYDPEGNVFQVRESVTQGVP